MTIKSHADRQPATSPSRHWSQSWSLRLATGLILLLVTGTQWWQAWSSNERLREETLAQAQLRAAQVTSAATELAALLLHAVDATSRELVGQYLTHPGKAFDTSVAQALQHLPEGAVLQVAVIGPDGYLAYSNLGMAERPFLGDREHFKVHLESSREERLFISRPVLGRVSKQWSIQFSRPMRRNGQLVGVLVMSMSPAYLHSALGRVTLSSDDSLAVLRQSGEFLARNRDESASLGKQFDPARTWGKPGETSSGTFTAPSPVDGVERIFQWQTLDDKPIVVLLGLSKQAVLGPVERVIAETNQRALASTLLLWTSTGLVLWLMRRVRAQVRRRKEAEFLAMHDSLTGLHSRHALMDHLDEALAKAVASGSRMGVLYMDLNGFKPVNDRHGHAIGDLVLQAVAGRIRRCIRGNDFPARIGGDEFVVVVDRLQDEAALERLAERIHHALAQPMSLSGVQVTIGASIGLAVGPAHGADADALLAHADRAMYAQKQAQPPVTPGPQTQGGGAAGSTQG